MQQRAGPSTTTRSEEHTSELQSRELTSYAVFCLKNKNMGLFLEEKGHVKNPRVCMVSQFLAFFFNDPATTEIYTSSHTLSLHAALPIRAGARADRPAAVGLAAEAPAPD